MPQEQYYAQTGRPEDDPEKGYLLALDIIRRAHEEGRPIVPFLGAGISAGSGYPLIDQMRSYLLKVKFFIKYGVYRTLLAKSDDRNVPDNRKVSVDDPENHLSTYIEEFGWPDLNQLNSDLYQFCEKELTNDPDKTAWIDNIVEGAFRARMAGNRTKENEPIDQYRAAKIMLRNGFPESRWGRRRWRLQTTTQHVVLEDMRLQDDRLAQLIQEKVWAMDLYPRVDWSRLLMELTEGKLGFIDALFARLSLRYSPGPSHILLAHLVARLGIKLLLTTNFDAFIEQALLNEGAQPRLLEIGRDAPPPDPSVVKQTLSVVKLHGGNSGLRIGERLDYALDEITQRSVADYVPNDALLLVIGFSGYERRMMQLIEHLVLRSPDSASPQGTSRIKVVWMHWEAIDKLPATVIEFEAKLHQVDKGPSFCKARLSDAAAFLLELYQNTAISLPKSRTSYPALQKRIIQLDAQQPINPDPALESANATPQPVRPDHAFTNAALETALLQDNYQSYLDDVPFHLFCRRSLVEDLPELFIFRETLPSAPSVRMSMFVHQRAGYHLIWIDLEDHHTVAGIVAEIIDKMRILDPDLPPLIFPLGPEEANTKVTAVPEPASVAEVLSEKAKSEAKALPDPGLNNEDRFVKAVLFIHRALRRGRYVLAFDSLEGFGREQTSHHGLPGETDGTDYLLQRMSDLLGFLRVLLALDHDSKLGEKTFRELDLRKKVHDLDCYCCIACDEPASRHLEKKGKPNPVRQEIRKIIQEFVKNPRWRSYPLEFTVFEKETREAIDLSRFLKHVIDKDSSLKAQSPVNADQSNQGVTVFDILEFDSVFQGNQGTSEISTQFYNLLEARWGGLQEKMSRTISTGLSKFVTRFDKIESPIYGDQDTAEPQSPSWLSECALPFLMLCVFRRPRSYVAIYSLWNQYLPGDWSVPLEKKRAWIRETLDSLSRHSLLNRMPGGYYWIPRHVHEWMYKALSESARLRDLTEQSDAEIEDLSHKSADSGDNIPARVTRLAFLTMIHSRIARFYFLHVFQRVQDVNALFEYVYHRVSAIRYAKTLYVYFNLAQQFQQAEKCKDSVAALLTYESIEGEQETQASGSSAGQDTKSQPLEKLATLRMRFLQSFLNVLRRERETMLTAASTDTWLAWIDQLTSELKYMVVNQPPSQDSTRKPANSAAVNLAWPDEDPRLIRLGQEMKWYLANLRSQLLREKRAWSKCIDHRVEILNALVDRVVEVGTKRMQGKKPRVHERMVNLSNEIKEGVWTANRSMGPDIAEEISKKLKVFFNLKIFGKKTLLRVCQGKFRDERDGANHVATAIESLLDIAACYRHLYFETVGERQTASQRLEEAAKGYHYIAETLLMIVEAKNHVAQSSDTDSSNSSASEPGREVGRPAPRP